jgi:hypothetical protein
MWLKFENDQLPGQTWSNLVKSGQTWSKMVSKRWSKNMVNEHGQKT